MKNGRQDRIAETLTPIPYFLYVCICLSVVIVFDILETKRLKVDYNCSLADVCRDQHTTFGSMSSWMSRRGYSVKHRLKNNCSLLSILQGNVSKFFQIDFLLNP